MPIDGSFSRALIHASRRFVLVRRIVLTLVGVFISLGLVSAWRAGFQVKSLTLTVAAAPAIVRATAIGRRRWLRLPPPLVREASVTISR
jgi:hypothetical protein